MIWSIFGFSMYAYCTRTSVWLLRTKVIRGSTPKFDFRGLGLPPVGPVQQFVVEAIAADGLPGA